MKKSLLFPLFLLTIVSLACNLTAKTLTRISPTVTIVASAPPTVAAVPSTTSAPPTTQATETVPPVSQPTATVPPVSQPTAPAVPTAAPSGSENSYFIDETGIVTYGTPGKFTIDVSQQHAWMVNIQQPGTDVAILPDGQLDHTPPSVTVDLNLTTGGKGQIAGVRCMFAGSKDYYQVALRDKEFAIGLMLDGKFSDLTSPVWKTSQFIPAGGFPGGADIEVACTPYGAGLSVNGSPEIPLQAGSNEHYPGGQIALFTESPASQPNGSSTSATFANLKIQEGALK